jgi:tRNA (mo5U34)-methyltransferase
MHNLDRLFPAAAARFIMKIMAAKRARSDPFSLVRFWDKQRSSKGWWHSFELPDGTRINGVCDLAGLKQRLAQFPIADDLRGRHVLDIGAWDGWFSFELERRGAEVMAIDNWDNPRFREMHAMLGSRVDYRQMDMYDLTPERIGRFDIVLFMGVLYHLKHPLLALERVCALTTGMAAVDSFVLREKHRPGEDVERRPIMEFYETNEFGGQTDNWVGPSLPCLLAFCRTAGFARVELRSVIEHSACVACYRKWEPASIGAPGGPELVDAFHNTNLGINFQSRYDEAVTAMFDWFADRLTLDDLRPEVGGYGVRPFHLERKDGLRWQTNFKLPPGLTPGWHDVSLRIRDSLPSNPRRVAVEIPLQAGEIRITGVSDGETWIPHQIDLSKGDSLAVWIDGLPENADRNNVCVYLDGARLPVTYIEAAQEGKPRQVNVTVPREAERGATQIGAAVGERRSEPVEIKIL